MAPSGAVFFAEHPLLAAVSLVIFPGPEIKGQTPLITLAI